MLIFSAGARHVISHAITGLPIPSQELWFSWSEAHPQVRVPENHTGDDQMLITPEVRSVVLAALESASFKMKEGLLRVDISEDEISDIDNDLSYLKAIEREVYRSLDDPR